MFGSIRAVLSYLVLCGFGWVFVLQSAAQADQSIVRVITGTGSHEFHTTVADTNETRSRGLMFRRSMASNDSMLFDFKTENPVFFWMKNTFIPLDMIFIRADGRVARVHHDAVPQSEVIIPSEEPVRYVLEVVAGTARKIALEPGDQVRHPIIDGQ